MAATRVRMVCVVCGSENVMHDAWAVWDSGMQEWVLGPVFDYMHCGDCERETHIEEVPIEESASRSPECNYKPDRLG